MRFLQVQELRREESKQQREQETDGARRGFGAQQILRVNLGVLLLLLLLLCFSGSGPYVVFLGFVSFLIFPVLFVGFVVHVAHIRRERCNDYIRRGR